jgi:hypothetical protein
MRRKFFLILTASMGIPLACSDHSPTSPEVGASTTSSESAEGPAMRTGGRVRHVVVVPPRPDQLVRPGVWGSEKVNLTITKDSATLEILSSAFSTGGCFGTYGEMAQPIPNGLFSIAGTYTQLIGAYPGKIQYSAQYTGVVESNRMSITITVPALQQAVGPFLLTDGVSNAWTPCLYP